MASEKSMNIARGLTQANRFLTKRMLLGEAEELERGKERRKSADDSFNKRLEILGNLAKTNPDAAATIASYAATGRPEDLLSAQDISPGRAAMAQLFGDTTKLLESGSTATAQSLGRRFGVPEDVVSNMGINPLLKSKISSEAELASSRRALSSYRAKQESELEKLSAARMAKIEADTDLARANLRKVNQEIDKKAKGGPGAMTIADFKRLSEIAVTDDKRVRDNLNSFVELHGIDPADIGADFSLDPVKYPNLQERWNYLVETFRESEATLGHIENNLRSHLQYKRAPNLGKKPITDTDALRRPATARPGFIPNPVPSLTATPENGAQTLRLLRQAQEPAQRPDTPPFGFISPTEFDFSNKSNDELLQMLLENDEEEE